MSPSNSSLPLSVALRNEINMDDVYGKCLCGQVEFQLSGELPAIYQCHCSRCRRATGSVSNAALIIPSQQFQWIRGQEQITSYIAASGYRSDFCSNCGSPVPNPLDGRFEYWIPTGLLTGNIHLKSGVHLYTGSKASWDIIPDNQLQYPETPGLDTLLKILQTHANP